MKSRKAGGAAVAVLAALAGFLALAFPAAASARDRNHDRIPDRWEKRYHLSLKVNQARRNQDHDALVNRQEFKAGTNPRDADTNDDGVEDGDDQGDDEDTGEDIRGTIASFDGTTLVIDLSRGGSVSGEVNAETSITCEGDEDEGDDGMCSAADLVPGEMVSDAELDASQTVFTDVDLGDDGEND